MQQVRRPAAATVLTVMAAVATQTMFAPAAIGVSGVESAYWQQRPGAAQVPTGGYEVASDATGPQAVAALRFTLDTSESQPVLALKLAQVVPDTSQLAVVACKVAPASRSWKAGTSPGAWSDRPQPDCHAGSVAGKLSSDGSTLTFDLSSLAFPDHLVNVVLQPDLVPSQVPGGTVPGVGGEEEPTYDAAFTPPSPTQISVASSSSGSGGSASFRGGGYPASGSTSTTAGGTNPALGTSLPAMSGTALAGFNSAPASAMVASPPVLAPASTAPSAAKLASQAIRMPRDNRRLLAILALLAGDIVLALLWLRPEADPAAKRPKLSVYDAPIPLRNVAS